MDASFRDLYRYSPAIFMSQQQIERKCKYKGFPQPKGNWWPCLCFVRHFLAHYVEKMKWTN